MSRVKHKTLPAFEQFEVAFLQANTKSSPWLSIVTSCFSSVLWSKWKASSTLSNKLQKENMKKDQLSAQKEEDAYINTTEKYYKHFLENIRSSDTAP